MYVFDYVLRSQCFFFLLVLKYIFFFSFLFFFNAQTSINQREKNPGFQTFKFLDMHARYPWFRSAFPSWHVQVEERSLANNIRDVNSVCLPEISVHYGDMILKSLRILLKHIKPHLQSGDQSGTHMIRREYRHLFSTWHSAPMMKTMSCNCESVLGSAHAYNLKKEMVEI